jgi:beta-N-acetylhexosaminidase
MVVRRRLAALVLVGALAFAVGAAIGAGPDRHHVRVAASTAAARSTLPADLEGAVATLFIRDGLAVADGSGGRAAPAGTQVHLGVPADVGWTGGAWEGRALGAEPRGVARAVARIVAADRAAGVVPVVGHFPGEGAASSDPAQQPATVGLALADLRRADLGPFATLAPTVPAIQMSAAAYAAWDGVTPATLEPRAIALLRGEGFRGAIVSADLLATSYATGGTVERAAVAAIYAGCDLIDAPPRTAAAAGAAVVAAVQRGTISPPRLRAALTHARALRTLVSAGGT